MKVNNKKSRSLIVTFSIAILIAGFFVVAINVGLNNVALPKDSLVHAEEKNTISLLEPINQTSKKDSIKIKMLNSTKFYDAVKGSFKLTLISNETEFTDYIDYNLNYIDTLSYVTVKDSSNTYLDEIIIDEGIYEEYTTYKNDENTKWTGLNIINEKTNSSKTEYVYIDENLVLNNGDFGNNLLTPATNSIHPEQLAILCLNSKNEWDIIETQKMLGREVYLLEGTISSDILSAKKDMLNKFEIYVDKETGIVLEYSIYDINGNLNSQLTTSEISIVSKNSSKEDRKAADIVNNAEIKAILEEKRTGDYKEQNLEKNPELEEISPSKK